MQPTSSSPEAQDALDVAVNQVGIGSGIDTGGTGNCLLAPARSPVWSTPQVHAYREVFVAVFPTREAADAGFERLEAAAGVNAGQCGLVVRIGPLTHARGLLARAGCADDGPFEALRQLGVPDEPARLYQQTFEAGQTVVAVRPTWRADRALRTLQQVVGTDTRQGLIDARPLERQPVDRPNNASPGSGPQPMMGAPAASRRPRQHPSTPPRSAVPT